MSYNNPEIAFRKSGYHEVDGDRSNQGSITTQYPADSIPKKPPGTTAECYPALPATAPSTIMRRDVVYVCLDEVATVTEDGPKTAAVRSSCANMPKPRPGREDAWCNRITVAGLAKNSMTDPQYGLYGPNGGATRANSKELAVQCAGAWNILYTTPKQVYIGDPLIFEPPDSKARHPVDERPVLKISPLHWSLLRECLKQLQIAALHLQSQGLPMPSVTMSAADYGTSAARGTWRFAAKEKVRGVSCSLAAGLVVLHRKGYVQLMTPTISKRAALKDRFVYEVTKALKKGGTGDVAAAQQALARYEDAMKRRSNGSDVADYDYDHRHTGFYHDPNSDDIGEEGDAHIYALNRESESYMDIGAKMYGGSDTHSNTLNEAKIHQHAVEWMIQNLGLAGNSGGGGGGYRDTTIAETMQDVLKLLFMGSLNAADRADAVAYLNSWEDYVSPQRSPAKEAFKTHLMNHVVGEAISHQQLRDSLVKRVWATALTSAIGTDEKTKFGVGSLLDVDIGRNPL